jgi:hypothetical protein
MDTLHLSDQEHTQIVSSHAHAVSRPQSPPAAGVTDKPLMRHKCTTYRLLRYRRDPSLRHQGCIQNQVIQVPE